MKQKTKTTTAISCTIGGHTTYISGQSTREFDSKYLPQYNPDPVHAVEFENEDHANEYLTKVVNNTHRKFDVVKITIPIIKDLKKYDREKKKEAQRKATPVVRRNVVLDALTIFIACIVLVSCSTAKKYGCPESRIEHKKFTA